MTDKLAKYGPSIFSTMTARALHYNAINLAQGFPDFPTDPRLIEAVNTAMAEGYNQYARPIGAPVLHRGIEQLVSDHYGATIEGDKVLTVYPGASFAIYIAIQAVLQAGDEVIVFEPSYECYVPAVELFGGIVRPVRLRAPGFSIDWDEVKAIFSQRTRLIIINNPHNPTASVWNKADLEALHQVVEGSDCLILSDEVYEFINYTDEGHLSLLSMEELWHRSLVISSFGKSLHVTGWRLGYCIAPPAITDAMRKINQFSVFCAHHASQVGVAHYLRHYFNPREIRELYRGKRDLVTEGLRGSRWKTLTCDGTYFIMLDYSDISDLPSMDFVEYLVSQHGLAAIPCSPFYSGGYDPKIIRICFAKKEETLQKALDILCNI